MRHFVFFEREVLTLFLKLYMMRELKVKDITDLTGDQKAEELGSEPSASLWPYYSEGSSKGCVASWWGLSKGLQRGPRLTLAALQGLFQLWGSVHGPCGPRKCGGSAEGWGEEGRGVLCGQVVCSAERSEWQMGLPWDGFPLTVPDNKMLHKETWQFSC